MLVEEPIEYYRKLPHKQYFGANFFVTWRLFGSLPKEVLFKLQQDKDRAIDVVYLKKMPIEEEQQAIEIEKSKYYMAFDDALDKITTGPHHLKNPEIANLVIDKLKSFDGEHYELQAYCVMSNHVHALMDFSIQIPEKLEDFDEDKYVQLSKVMKLIKGSTGFQANRMLGLKDEFWESENFDRYIRNEKHRLIVENYILQNPVKAGICKHWEDYPFSGVRVLTRTE
jgi:putative transposase